MPTKDDIAILGVPCPLFSRLNMKVGKKGYNPFEMPLGYNASFLNGEHANKAN